MRNIYKSLILTIIGFLMLIYPEVSRINITIDFDLIKEVAIPMIGLVIFFVGFISLGSFGEVIFGKEK